MHPALGNKTYKQRDVPTCTTSPYNLDSFMSGYGCVSSWRCRKQLQLDLKKVNAKGPSVSKNKVQPISDNWTDIVSKGPFYATVMRKGRRPEMEDCCKTLFLPQPGKLLACFGVFDGHGGVTAAKFASDHLLGSISQHKTIDETSVSQAFLETDQRLLGLPASANNHSGTTALIAVLHEEEVIVANAGDSRGLLISDNSCTQVSYDHVACDPFERQRVESAGGYVFQVGGASRVQGTIAVTRGLGSARYKQFVIPDPHVASFSLNPHDQFLLLATDGLYMRLCNEELKDLILENAHLPLDQLANLLTEVALARGSPDNISLTLVDLRALFALTKPKQPMMLVDDDELMAEQPTQAPLATPRGASAKRFF